jgi:hypothetical protein
MFEFKEKIAKLPSYIVFIIRINYPYISKILPYYKMNINKEIARLPS